MTIDRYSDVPVTLRTVTVFTDGRVVTSEAPWGYTGVEFHQLSIHGDFRRPSPFSFSKLKRELVRGPNIRTNDYYGSSVSVFPGVIPNYYYPGDIPQSAFSIVHNRCVEEFYELARASEISMATTIGEAPELAQMRAQLAKIVEKAKGWRQKIKKVGSAHLFVAFGVRPLIGDVEAYASHVHNTFVKNGITVRVRASTSGRNTWYPEGREGHTAFDAYDVREEIKANLTVGDPTLYDAWRLGVSSAFSTAWELTTLSFLVDYFYSVGGYIQAMEASLLSGLTVNDGYVSVGTKMETVHWLYESSTSGLFETTFTNMQGKLVKTTFERSFLTSLPRPYLPVLQVDLGSSQLLNVAALLSGLLRDR